MKLNDEILKKAAEQYALKYGEEQLKKTEFLNREVKNLPLDGAPKIADIARARSKKSKLRLSAGLAAAAVCVALAVIIPLSFNNLGKVGRTELTESAQFDETDYAPAQAESAAEEDKRDQGGNADISETVKNYGGAFGSQIMLAEKKLPKGYRFTSVNEDNGEAVCEIAGDAGDEITLTLARASGETSDKYENMGEYDLDGIYAYGASYPDYSYLTYEIDGVDYTFTCKYDLSLLLNLAADISG